MFGIVGTARLTFAPRVDHRSSCYTDSDEYSAVRSVCVVRRCVVLLVEGPDWTVNEVAADLRVHPVTVYRWVREGRIRGYRLGRSVRIHRGELERLKMASAADA